MRMRACHCPKLDVCPAFSRLGRTSQELWITVLQVVMGICYLWWSSLPQSWELRVGSFCSVRKALSGSWLSKVAARTDEGLKAITTSVETSWKLSKA